MDNTVEEKVEQKTEPEKRRIEDVDKMALELARSRKQLALSQAEKAAAQQESAELAYRYVVLQIFVKYGLSNDDNIDEAGNIIIGGAKQ